MSAKVPSNLHPSLKATFIALPSDIEIPLTEDQLKAVFPNTEVWRDMISQTMTKNSLNVSEPNVDESA